MGQLRRFALAGLRPPAMRQSTTEMREGNTPTAMPQLEDGTCQVWWARPMAARPTLGLLLDQAERDRWRRLVRKDDQDRFMVAVALARLVLAWHLDSPPDQLHFDRTCRICGTQHGKPRLTGDRTGLQFSVSHSGQRVAVAVVRHAHVGMDVEQIVPGLEVEALAREVLSEDEREVFDELASGDRQRGFLTYWTRKEALLKATGDGLRVPMDSITVSGPGESPVLRRWSGPSQSLTPVALRTLHPGSDHVASLAVLGLPTVRVHELDAEALLATPLC